MPHIQISIWYVDTKRIVIVISSKKVQTFKKFTTATSNCIHKLMSVYNIESFAVLIASCMQLIKQPNKHVWVSILLTRYDGSNYIHYLDVILSILESRSLSRICKYWHCTRYCLWTPLLQSNLAAKLLSSLKFNSLLNNTNRKLF